MASGADDPSRPLLHSPDGAGGGVRGGSDEMSSSHENSCCCFCCSCGFELARPGKLHMDGQERLVSKGGATEVTDEVVNTATHFVGLMLSILGVSVLVTAASVEGKVWHIVAFAIYGSTLVLLYLASILHHAIHSTPGIEAFFLSLDYIAIFPLIAGTFTPFCLVMLHDSWVGWMFFGVTWGIAISGILLVAILQQKLPRWVNFTMYITLGWFGAALGLCILPIVGLFACFLIALGGVLYTVGGAVFMLEKPNLIPGVLGFHEIWHIFVLLASLTHWVVMYAYVLPYPYEHEASAVLVDWVSLRW